MNKAKTIAALSALDGINFFGVHIANPKVATLPATMPQEIAAHQHEFDKIAFYLADASERVTNEIDMDLSHQNTYEFQPLISYGRMTAGTPVSFSGISVFADSGLPRIEKLGIFLDSIVSDFGSQGIVPFFDISDRALRHVWPPRPGQIGLRDSVRNALGKLSRYLMRMNWRDSPAWQGARSERWERALQAPLAFYLTELFGGRFVDRNAKAIKFSLGVDLTNIGELSNVRLSPELAGKVVSCLVEFLGDVVFKVPFYSQAILDIYETKRTNAEAITANADLSQKLTNAVVSGNLSVADAKELGLPITGDLDWTVLFKPDPADPTIPEFPKYKSTIVGSQLCRLLDTRTIELDQEFLFLQSEKTATENAITSIIANTSDLQSLFTIRAAGITLDFMKCQFLPEDGLGCATDIGSANDYASLVGKLVALSAEAAETNVRALVGGAVRGISLLALENEVIAEVISSAAGTAAKKAAEAVTYILLTNYINDTSIDVETRRARLEALRAIHERQTEETEE